MATKLIKTIQVTLNNVFFFIYLMVADFNKKQKGEFFNKKLLFQAAGILFFVFVIVLIFADFKIYQKKKELLSQISSYQKQIQEIENSSKTLQGEIANSDNKDYLEKIAYEQLGEQKPGEKEVIFTSPEKKPAAGLSNPGNFWSVWLSDLQQWLKNNF